jgi:hypothetical protein
MANRNTQEQESTTATLPPAHVSLVCHSSRRSGGSGMPTNQVENP